MTGVHQQVLMAIQGRLIENLITTLEVIATQAHGPGNQLSKLQRIAVMADNAIEAAKALNVKGLSHACEQSTPSLHDQENA